MHIPTFVTVPTKTVVQIDHDALIKMAREGPILLAPSEHNVMKALYIHAKRQGVDKLTMKTVTFLQDGALRTAYMITMKPLTQG